MEIKCPLCDVVPEIEINYNIQGIKFICKDKISKKNIHYGIFSINNFYKRFIQNKDYNDIIEKFIQESELNYENNNISDSSSLFHFISYTKEIEKLIIELNKILSNFKNYFYKFLYINEILHDKKYISEYQTFQYTNIIEKMKELIKYINNLILIKEDFPKILTNDELNIKINELCQFKGNTSKFDLNKINKDFEYKNSLNNNICIKKIIDFNSSEAKNFIFFKLNEKLSPNLILFSYQLKNKKISVLNIYDNNINKLIAENFDGRIWQILQLKDNSLLLILDRQAFIMNIDINNKKLNLIQEIETTSKLFIETSINNNNNNISLLLPINVDYYFYKYKNSNENKYRMIQSGLSTKINGEDFLFYDDYNFMGLDRTFLIFYNLENISDKKISIKSIKKININSFLLGMQFICSNKEYFLTISFDVIYLVSYKYREIVSIFKYYQMDQMYTGINNECYICMNNWISGHKIIRQINIDEKGDLIVEGNNFFRNIDFYSKYGILDLGETILYIKDLIND